MLFSFGKNNGGYDDETDGTYDSEIFDDNFSYEDEWMGDNSDFNGGALHGRYMNLKKIKGNRRNLKKK